MGKEQGRNRITRRLAIIEPNYYLFPECKKPPLEKRGLIINSLTMTYFHTGTRTIIGAEAFHCPVRDGKEWDHLAMVIRLNWPLVSTAKSCRVVSSAPEYLNSD